MYAVFAASQHISLSTPAIVVLVLLIIWEGVWKGIALWHAGRNNQLAWFILMLVVNTAGILEIAYLLFFQRKSKLKDTIA